MHTEVVDIFFLSFLFIINKYSNVGCYLYKIEEEIDLVVKYNLKYIVFKVNFQNMDSVI